MAHNKPLHSNLCLLLTASLSMPAFANIDLLEPIPQDVASYDRQFEQIDFIYAEDGYTFQAPVCDKGRPFYVTRLDNPTLPNNRAGQAIVIPNGDNYTVSITSYSTDDDTFFTPHRVEKSLTAELTIYCVKNA